jgi:transposase
MDGMIKPLRDVIREHILHALEVCDGNRMHAAKLLGIGRRTLNDHIVKYRRRGYVAPRAKTVRMKVAEEKRAKREAETLAREARRDEERRRLIEAYYRNNPAQRV